MNGVDKKWKLENRDFYSLPENLRNYIKELETMADPSYLVQQYILTKDENEMLRAKIKEMKNETTA